VLKTSLNADANLPNQAQQTLIQVGICLNVVASLTPHVLKIHEPHDTNDPAHDGGTTTAAQETFIKTCALLDSILEDKPRWNIDNINRVEKAKAEMLEAETARAKTHEQVLKDLARPRAFLRPTIQRIDAYGIWMASYGGTPGDPRAGDGEPLIGIGTTPEESLADFDANFNKAYAAGKFTVAQLKRAVAESDQLFRDAKPENDPDPKGYNIPILPPAEKQPKRKKSK